MGVLVKLMWYGGSNRIRWRWDWVRRMGDGILRRWRGVIGYYIEGRDRFILRGGGLIAEERIRSRKSCKYLFHEEIQIECKTWRNKKNLEKRFFPFTRSSCFNKIIFSSEKIHLKLLLNTEIYIGALFIKIVHHKYILTNKSRLKLDIPRSWLYLDF